LDKEDREASTEEFGNRMQQQLATIPGVKVTISDVDITGNSNQAPIMILVKGNDRTKIRETAEAIKGIIDQTPGTIYSEFSTKTPKPEIDVQLDREKMALFGLNATQVGMAIGNNFRGNDQAKYKFEGNEY